MRNSRNNSHLHIFIRVIIQNWNKIFAFLFAFIWFISFFFPHTIDTVNVQLVCIISLFGITEILMAKGVSDKSLLNFLPSLICLLISLFFRKMVVRYTHTPINNSVQDWANVLVTLIAIFLILSVIVCYEPLLKKYTPVLWGIVSLIILEYIFEIRVTTFADFAIINITLMMYVRFVLNNKYWDFFPGKNPSASQESLNFASFLSYLLTFGFTLMKFKMTRNISLNFINLLMGGPLIAKTYEKNLCPTLSFLRNLKHFKSLALRIDLIAFLATIFLQVLIWSLIIYIVSVLFVEFPFIIKKTRTWINKLFDR